MAYSLVVDTSNFRPYDYNLMIGALKDYNNEYEKQLAVYDKIALTLGDLSSAVQDSTVAKLMYESYLDRFNAAVDQFSRGMNVNTAKELGALRKLYGTLIRLLERANEARVKAAEYLRAQNKDNLYLHEDLGTLDDWMNNPNRDIRGYSGTQLTNEVGALTKAASNDIVNLILNGHADPYTKKFLKTRGFSSLDVDRTIVEVLQGGVDSVTNPIMKSILKSAMDSSGIYNWADEATKRKAEIIAARGLYQGVGQADITAVKDEAANKQLDYDWAIKLAQKQADIDVEKAKRIAENNKPSTSGSAVINPSNIYSAEEAANLVSNIEKYDKYFTTDGNGKTFLNKDGIEMYNKNMTPKVSTSSSGSGTARLMNAETIMDNLERPFTPSDFRRFVDDELGGKKVVEKRLYGNLGNLWNQYKQKDFLKYDVTGLTEYNHNIDPSEYNNWKDRIAERAQGYLEKVTWDKNKKAWVSNDNDRIPISDIYANSNPTSTQSSIYGRTVKMVDKEGNTTRYRLPRGINTRAELNIENHLKALNVVLQLYTQLDDTGRKVLTFPEADFLNNVTGTQVFTPGVTINKATLLRVNTLLEDALATFESQLGVTNTNKPLEWDPIAY